MGDGPLPFGQFIGPPSECGDGLEESWEQCDDGNTLNGDCCSALCQIEPAATECRASVDDCDVAETCGGAATCPVDGFQANTVECRGAAGECDVAESCTGSSATCPVDTKSTAMCRISAGVCDVAESCDGTSNTCPADGFVSAGAECRGSAGVCDVAESCDGSGKNCPTDILASAMTICRPAAGDCDIADNCTGTSTACPADGFKAAGTACIPPDGDICTQDVCSGIAASCTYPPVPIVCGNNCVETGEQCDDGNTTNGDGGSSTCQGTHIEARASAFGVTTTINGPVAVNLAPTPTVSCLSGAPCDNTTQLASLSVASLLQTKVLRTHADTLVVSQTGDAGADATVADATISVLGLLTLKANAIQSTAEVTGMCGQGLLPAGTTTITNGSSSGLLGLLLAANPAPNTTVLNLLGIKVVLNEQILSGDGVLKRKLTVNAISISINNVLVNLLLRANGKIIVSQSVAEVDCVVPGP